MAEEIVNRVANSGLVTIDLEEYYDRNDRVLLDIKEWLFQGIVLKEKEFRNFIAEHDWDQYIGNNVAIVCTADAIIPTWAYMLVVIKLEPVANAVVMGGMEVLETVLMHRAIAKIDPEEFRDAKLVIKGCGNLPVPTSAYVELVRILRPVAASIMYGEPCSTVPLYKKKKNKLFSV